MSFVYFSYHRMDSTPPIFDLEESLIIISWSLIFITVMMSYQQEPSIVEINTHRTEILILAILHVSAWACLIRSDYNFVFLFFAYFYIVSKKDKTSIFIIFGLVIMLLVMDVLFFIFVPGSWMAYQENNTVWNNLRGMHGFAIFLSVVIFLLKIPLVYLIFMHRKQILAK